MQGVPDSKVDTTIGEDMTVAHAPLLMYLCTDPECCDNGCPHVSCRACKQDWPCADWRSRHNESQVRAQYRYVARKHFPGDERLVAYSVRRAMEALATE